MSDNYYVLVRFNIETEKFQELYYLIKEFFEKEVNSCPGFISSKILTNEDKTLVINYATWESKQKFENFAQNIVSKSNISKKIEFFNPIRETFYEFEYLPKVD
ncbi:antibiotic biosynthesis monooxygenase family protein [Zunongwangia endophytica]|uniref:Antibiotic biosynthesis monooxygenase family protein n=1 Tax=Zunongwangia endophytica TaxID=1808945 RepID=A0ABV8HE46_9FLAO|nr:antibiotic biosynthesis monooxygenase [Zunongwangia endophytica]MDN3594356.1 antibiotic biosynthesis monooxygenase [Zunongwangia endophytica]